MNPPEMTGEGYSFTAQRVATKASAIYAALTNAILRGNNSLSIYCCT
jgi:hypothetical protein